MFSVDLLQAINDWQRGGDAPTKRARGVRLKQLAAALPARFREVSAPCYRRLALPKGPVFDLGERFALPEAISAWTLDLAVAKEFKDGVPEPGWLGVIFEFRPAPEQVVANLNALYSEFDFTRACDSHRGDVKDFAEGVGRYGNSQHEVVLELPHIAIDSVFALGGAASEMHIDNLAKECLGRPLSEDESRDFREITARSRGLPGDWWLMGEGKDLVVTKWKRKAQCLAPKRAEERGRR